MKTLLSSIFVFLVGFAWGQKVELFVPSSSKPVYSKDNNWLATYSKKTLQVWKSQKAELVWQFHYREKKVDDSKIYHFEEAIPAFSNNSKFVAVADRDKNLFVWDITNGDSVLKIKMPERITRIIFFKGDSVLAATGETDESSSFRNVFSYIVNIKNGDIKRILGKGLYFNSDSTRLVLEFHTNTSTDYNTYLNIWDIKLNKIINKLRAYNEWGFSKDGNYLFYDSYPKGLENNSEYASIKIFDFAKNKLISILKGEINTRYNFFNDITKTLDFPNLIYHKGNQTIIYDIQKKKKNYSLNEQVSGHFLNQDLIFGRGETYTNFYNSTTGKYINSLNDGEIRFINNSIVINFHTYENQINCYTNFSRKRLYTLKNESIKCISTSSKFMVTHYSNFKKYDEVNPYFLRYTKTGKKLIRFPSFLKEDYYIKFSKDDRIVFFYNDEKLIIYYIDSKKYFVFKNYESFRSYKEGYSNDKYLSMVFNSELELIETADSLIYINGKTNTLVWNRYTQKIFKKISWDGTNDIPTYLLNTNEKKLLFVNSNYRTFKQLDIGTGKLDYLLKNKCNAAHDWYCDIHPNKDGSSFYSNSSTACNHCRNGFEKFSFKNGRKLRLSRIEDSLRTVYPAKKNKTIEITVDNNQLKFYQLSTGKPLYTYIPLDENNFIVYDEEGHYDASENALQYVYYSCGNKVVPASKTNYKSRVVGLVQKIMSNQKHLIIAPTKEELNICNLID